jgi:hypothetical protein
VREAAQQLANFGTNAAGAFPRLARERVFHLNGPTQDKQANSLRKLTPREHNDIHCSDQLPKGTQTFDREMNEPLLSDDRENEKTDC